MSRALPILTLAMMLCLRVGNARAEADFGSLFEKMSGNWSGIGERVQLISGRRIRIEARATANQQDQRLVSHNEIIETSESGLARHYVRNYWIRPAAASGGFELGQNEQVTSQGRFDGGILEVEQILGGTPALVIRSRTQFDNRESLYQETTWHGDQELSRTIIRYVRD